MRDERSKADLQAEIKWLYETLWKLIQNSAHIQQHHAGLTPGDVARIRTQVTGQHDFDDDVLNSNADERGNEERLLRELQQQARGERE